jgi:prepilin-type N-terminal cleavage/methylation domain-containing protein
LARQHQRPKGGAEGFTLPEVLISTGILSLILVACYALIVFAIRWNAKMGDTVDTYQRALNASSRISYDLGAGSQSTFLYDVEGFAVASARPDTGPYQLDPSGRLLMQKWVLYQLVGETLYRNEIPIDPPLTKVDLMDTTPEPEYLTLKASLTTPGSVQAENLTDLEIEGGASASVLFKVEGNKEDDLGEKVNSITIRSRINFRS